MTSYFKQLSFLCLFLLGISTSQAQITKPNASPRAQLTQQIGLATAKLDYGKPAVKGRKIFGELIPFGKVWRAGANASTKISFNRDIMLHKQAIPTGEYALYVIPNKTEWTIIISKNTKLWGAGGYDAKDDLVRFNVATSKLKAHQETFYIGFENFHANGGDLIITWEKTKIVMPIFIDTDAVIYKEIKEKVINASGEIKAGTYFDAASFYVEKGKDLDQAAKWFDKAIELRPKAFWYLYARAELAFKQNDRTTARRLSEKSLKMAQESAADYGYIAKNELLLKKIK